MTLRRWLRHFPKRVAYVVYLNSEYRTNKYLEELKDRHLDTDISCLDKVSTKEWNDKKCDKKFDEDLYDFVQIIRLERMKIYD